MPSLRPSALREACVCLCASVQAEARAISRPEIVSSLALLSSQLHTVPPPSIAAPLCSLVYHLLRGVPTRLSREAVGVLGRVEEAGVSFSEQLLSEGAASSLFKALLHHGNREVRSHGLSIISSLAPYAATLDEDSLRGLTSPLTIQRLFAIMCDKASSDKASEMATQAAIVLRGLCRSALGSSLCEEAGVGRQLELLPPHCWQGALGVALGEINLRLGRVGLPSSFGRSLSALCSDPCPSDDRRGGGKSVGARSSVPFVDGLMEWEDGSQLQLHRVVLAARAPVWAHLLTTHGSLENETVDAASPLAPLPPASCLRWRVTHTQLSPEGCGCLYRLALSGTAVLPRGLSPKGLYAMAETLGMSGLIFAPPADAGGVLWLKRHMSCALGHSVTSDVVFVLRDGSIPAHRCLLAARSEYFERMFSWNGGGGRHVHVRDASCAGFAVVLRHVYSGTQRSQPAQRAAEAGGEKLEGVGKEGVNGELAAWRRLALQSEKANRDLAAAGEFEGATIDGVTDASVGLEVLLLARRYLLTSLAHEASAVLVGMLKPSDVLTLWLIAQEEGEDEVTMLIADWAISHFEQVSSQIDSWIASNLITAPPRVRGLGEEQLGEIREQLRAAMVKQRYGLG
ncbi:MAG: hypothetical protein SGPRY_008476 [Prymnesium sp.]